VYKGCVESTFFEGFEPQRVRSRPKDSQDVVDFVNNRLGFEPDERQMEVLRSTAKRGILNCTRQWGKSTVAAAKAVHRAYTREGSEILVASPGKRQSAEFLRKAAAMLRTLGIRPRGDGDNEVSLLLPNGSRIVGLPGTEATVRGFSAVSLLSKAFDNWSYAEQRFMVSSMMNSKLAALSTPISFA
jgi:hypothetical protein